MEFENRIDMSSYPASSSIQDSATEKPKPVRKKFAVPPVKVACLECRASRTRCDGAATCSNCINKGKTCVYTQSKRGGSRIRKRKVPLESTRSTPPLDNKDLNQCALTVLPEEDQASFAVPLSFVTPGGGLRQLDLLADDNIDFEFDSFFPMQQDSGYETSNQSEMSPGIEHTRSYVRLYASDEDILSAYYVYIHPFFPVLPPPSLNQVTDNPDFGFRHTPDSIFTSASAPDFEPSSPISLAISASLALIPHPDDPNPSDQESIRVRREQAQAYARAAFEYIEVESELEESNNDPAEALSSEPRTLNRNPFHPQNPIENESIIALLMLSTYEYAQRGNVSKLRNRAGQALHAAMNLGLHERGDEDGFFAEANRRVWWMTYIVVLQGAILSNSTPPILLYDPRFSTAQPTFAADVSSWSVFLQAQQMIATATQFVLDLDTNLKRNVAASEMWDRMLELDALLEPLVVAANGWNLASLPPASLDRSELCCARALRGMASIKLNSARIKLHRYCAFADVPVFTKKHCDLKPSSALNSPIAPQCGCSSTFHSMGSNGELPATSKPSTLVSPNPVLLFSSNFSAKICFKAAFNIANSFHNLPIPQPVRPTDAVSFFPPLVQNRQSPRMVPIFACCAMQASYSMIMLSHRTRSMGPAGVLNESRAATQAKMLAQLYEGLQTILAALTNYSMAYEAMGGMRDQIEEATRSVQEMQIGGI